MDPQSFTPITVRGAELRYRRSGSGEPLVLLHANISDARSFTKIEPLLAQHFDVVTLCRRYHWPNEPLPDRHDDPWEEHAHDTADLIEKLNLAPAHVLGNSSSALVALMLARNRPELVRSLILEEPVGITIFLPRTPPGILDLLHLLWYFPRLFIPIARFGATVIPACEAAFKKGDNEAGLQVFNRAVIGEEHMSIMPPERVDQMMANVKPHAALFTAAEGLPKFSEQDLRNIKAPTLFMTGATSAPMHMWMDRYMASMIRGAKDVQLQGAGHLVHEDKPDEVVREMLRYLKTA